MTELSQPPSPWRKSSYSGQNTACVEVAPTSGGAAVRDSKDPSAGHFAVDRPQWSEFLDALRRGVFDG